MAAVFNNCDYCISEQNRPVPTHLPSLQTIIHRYAQVADEVNQKEFKRFTQEIRAKWHPLPPAQDEWEEGYRGEGWTDEGAFTLCVYQLSTGSDKPHREEGPLCEAEKRNQVLFRRPLESLIDDYWKKPLREPLLENEIVEGLARLRDGVQRQLSEDAADVDLPEDFESLMRITNGVHGAGVPSETAYTVLVKPLGAHSVERYMPGEGPNSSEGAEVTFWRQDGFTPFAAWKIGGCQQHRHIYYVLCRNSTDDSAPMTWKIFDRADVELQIYDNLSHFLSHETAHIEAKPGGHQQEHILYSETYPETF